jgi:predicted PurR-regulated permease PerM
MAATSPRPRLRISTRSIAAAVGVFALTLIMLRMVAAAGRVLGWMLVAAAFAGLLHPLVSWLARVMPRAVAAILVMLAGVAVTAFVARGLVEDVVRETERLQQTAREATAEIEQSRRFGEFARQVELQQRMDDFIDHVPERLAGGGTPADRFRAAATRGVAFLATAVLTLFLLLHGPRIASAALAQISDDDRRERIRRVAMDAYRRAFGYARGTLLSAFANGGLGYLLARDAGVRGAGALAVWVALWSVVPVAGSVIGALPIVVLGALEKPLYGVLLSLAFIAIQVFEDLVWQPRLERRTLTLGPFLTVVSGLVGLELRGLPGALLAVLGMAVVMAVLDDLAPDVAAADVRDAELADPAHPTPGDVVDESDQQRAPGPGEPRATAPQR